MSAVTCIFLLNNYRQVDHTLFSNRFIRLVISTEAIDEWRTRSEIEQLTHRQFLKRAGFPFDPRFLMPVINQCNFNGTHDKWSLNWSENRMSEKQFIHTAWEISLCFKPLLHMEWNFSWNKKLKVTQFHVMWNSKCFSLTSIFSIMHEHMLIFMINFRTCFMKKLLMEYGYFNFLISWNNSSLILHGTMKLREILTLIFSSSFFIAIAISNLRFVYYGE